MAFWSGEKLSAELPNLVSSFDPARIDCASYKLRVGEQVFVTSDKFENAPPTAPLISVLESKAPNHTLRIRPGQFAFILTEESVSVPNDAFALISMSTRFKFRGLINVSGFHVDPGWKGQLIFAVYNAGPSEIVIARGQAMFLIVYADLDRQSTMVFGSGAPGLSQAQSGQNAIRAEMVQNMADQVFSPQMLQRRMDDLQDKMRAVQETANLFKYLTIGVTTGVTLLLAVAALWAAFAPATLGVILARMMDGGGYEMRLKSPEACSQQPCASTPAVPPTPSASAPAKSTSASEKKK